MLCLKVLRSAFQWLVAYLCLASARLALLSTSRAFCFHIWSVLGGVFPARTAELAASTRSCSLAITAGLCCLGFFCCSAAVLSRYKILIKPMCVDDEARATEAASCLIIACAAVSLPPCLKNVRNAHRAFCSAFCVAGCALHAFRLRRAAGGFFMALFIARWA